VASELTQYWIKNAWFNRSQINYTYDSDHFLTSEVNKLFDDTGVSILFGDSIHYYFHTVTGINELKPEDGNFIVYPNPSCGKFTVSNSNISTIEIYNILGERIYSNNRFNHQISAEIDLSDRGKGIYFINIYDGTKMYNRRIILQ